MKKIILAFAIIQISLTSFGYTTITVKGKNMGTTTTTSQDVNGNTISTTKVDCDNFYDMTCLTIKTNGPVKAGVVVNITIPEAPIYGLPDRYSGTLVDIRKIENSNNTSEIISTLGSN